MSGELLVALIAGAISLATAIGTIWASIRNSNASGATAQAIQKLKAAGQREKEMLRFREPFARAIYDLQSRIFNIVNQGFMDTFLVRGNVRERSYAMENTTYLIAQCLCWSELVRREVQFIYLEDDEKTRQLLHKQNALMRTWASDGHSVLLRIFAGEQRAIGEALIVGDSRGVECMGYGLFLNSLGHGTNSFIDAIRADVVALGENEAEARPRLAAVQHALIDLLLLLDPAGKRFPKESITKI